MKTYTCNHTHVYPPYKTSECKCKKGRKGLLAKLKKFFKKFGQSVEEKHEEYTIKTLKEKAPHVDWTNQSEFPKAGFDFNTEPVPLQLDAKLNDTSVYTNTYTSFSGCDIVASFNGDIYGALQAFKYDVDGEMKGKIEFSFVQFDRNNIIPDDSLMVVTYANEYGHTAYQVVKLGKKLKYSTGASMDNVMSTEAMVYECEILTPLRPVLPAAIEMPDTVFEDMVAKVYAKCTNKKYLKDIDEKPPTNNLANRVYFYTLYKNFCQEEA